MKNKIKGCLPLFLLLFISQSYAGVVLNVRAVNPLDEVIEETIRYKLPVGIKPEHIKEFKVEGQYVLPVEDSVEEVEKTPKKQEVNPDYNIFFDEERQCFFIEIVVKFAPKGVIRLTLDLEDVWYIEKKIIEELHELIPEVAQDNQLANNLQEIILKQLDKIMELQKKNEVSQVGVEEHIKAYEKNIKILEQVKTDLRMLESLIAQ